MSKSDQNSERLTEVRQKFEAPQWYLHGRSYHVRVRTGVVGHLLANQKIENILDIGCGDGSISVPLLQQGRKLTLLDMSESMLSIAQSRVPANLAGAVQVVNGDILGAKLPEGAFDVVICLGVFAYFKTEWPLIDKLNSLLKPGGTLIVECSDSAHFMSGLMRTYDRLKGMLIRQQFKTNAHAAATLVSGLTAAGFQKVGSYRYCAPTRVSRKLFPQSFHFWKIKALFGNAERPRSQWLGNECIFWFKKESKSAKRESANRTLETAEASA